MTYEIRPATARDLPGLPAIERDAGLCFPPEARSSSVPAAVPLDTLQRLSAAGTLWVAVDGRDRPVGFLAAEPRGGTLFITELDVLRRHHRRGLGRRLIDAAEHRAAETALPALTLTTDRHLPFNMPLYQKLGFQPYAGALPPFLRRALDAEEAGARQRGRRVAMRRPVEGARP